MGRAATVAVIATVMVFAWEASGAAEPATRPATGNIFGVVVDSGGRAVPGADVWVTPRLVPAGILPVAKPVAVAERGAAGRGRTDDKGRYSIDAAPGACDIEASKGDLVGATYLGVVRAGASGAAVVSVARRGSVSVGLQDPGGRPLAGATVQLVRRIQPLPEETTDVGGFAAFRGLPAGEYDFFAWAEGGLIPFQTAPDTIVLSAGGEVSVVSRVAAVEWVAVRGRVTDFDGKPVARAEVLLHNFTGPRAGPRPNRWSPVYIDQASASGTIPRAVTGADGSYRIRLPVIGRRGGVGVLVTLGNEGEPEMPLYAADTPADWPGGTAQADIALPPTALITGVVSHADGRPGAGARVAVGGARVTAGPDGRFAARWLPGQVTLLTRHGWLSTRATVAAKAGETTQVNVSLPRGGTVTGLVRWGDGAPASGISVRPVDAARPLPQVRGGPDAAPGTGLRTRLAARDGPAATTGADGRYVLNDLEPGDYRLECADEAPYTNGIAAMTLFREWSAPVTVLAGATATSEAVALPAATAEVTVVGADGQPCAGFAVNPQHSRGGADLPCALTDAAGRATLRVPGGQYAFLVRRANIQRGRAAAKLEARTVVPLNLRLSATGSFSARVVDGAGRPAAGVVVSLHQPEGLGFSVVTDADGACAVADAPVGNYTARLQFDERSHPEVTVGEVKAGGATFAALRISYGTVAGRIVDEAGGGVAGAEVSLNGSNRRGGRARSDRDGRFAITGVPVGKYPIEVSKSGYRKASANPTEVDARDGETVRVDLALLPNPAEPRAGAAR